MKYILPNFIRWLLYYLKTVKFRLNRESKFKKKKKLTVCIYVIHLACASLNQSLLELHKNVCLLQTEYE